MPDHNSTGLPHFAKLAVAMSPQPAVEHLDQRPVTCQPLRLVAAQRIIRLLNSVPGLLAWLTLVAAIWGALAGRTALLWSTAILSAYLALRFGLAVLAWAHGLRLIRRWEKLDWRAEWHRRADTHRLPWDEVQHLVLLPSVAESEALLRRSLDRLAAWPDAPRAMSVVLAMEAGDSAAPERAARLQRAYAGRFRRVLVTLHPAGLPGEVRGKSANLAWATRHARQTLVGEEGIAPERVIVTVMDADTLWHPAYFDCLTTLFATNPQRHATFWQAPIRYHGNIWTAHWLMRPLHAQASAWELAYLAAPWWLALPMSSYSVSLCLLDSVGGWATDAIADDWHMYLRSFFARRGQLRLQPIFLPFLAHIVCGRSARETAIARLRQTVRHAWGAEEIGHALAGAPAVRGIAGWRLAVRVAHDHLLAGAGALLLGLGTQLPALLAPTWLRTQFTAPPFLVIQLSLVALTAISVLFWYGDRRLRPAAPPPTPNKSILYELIALLLLPTLTALCVTLPVLCAQTRLILGRSPRFEVSTKE